MSVTCQSFVRSQLVFIAALLSMGCATSAEKAARRDVLSPDRARSSETPPTPQSTAMGVNTSAPSATPVRDTSSGRDGLSVYIAQAMRQSPELRASFERWQASVHRISRARRLPDPILSFGYFIRAVETRVGPQRARISLKQSFPWPSSLSAGADAASAQARARQKRFDALAFAVTRRVSDAYWQLWLVREKRKIHTEHLKVLRSLSESALARVVIGTTTLADLQQIDLAAARLEDMLRGIDEKEYSAAAQLRAAIGISGNEQMPTPEVPPEICVPSESRKALLVSVRKHPLIESYGLLALAQDEKARVEAAAGLPSFSVGADWIITGEARMPDIEDSGKDAVVVGAGISVPLWHDSYSDSVDAARAEASAQRSEQQAAINRASAELDSSMSAVRDAVRRVDLYRHTLVPQAESAYVSVLGAYAAGRATVAQTLLSQSALLELREELEQARVDHARAWARLEQVVGHEVRAALRADPAKVTAGETVQAPSEYSGERSNSVEEDSKVLEMDPEQRNDK